MLVLYLVKIPYCKSTLVNDFVFSSSLWDGWVDAVCIYVFICVICTFYGLFVYYMHVCIFVFVYIYIYICVCVFVCMYIYIYITICNLRTIYNIIISYLEFDPYRYIPPWYRNLGVRQELYLIRYEVLYPLLLASPKILRVYLWRNHWCLPIIQNIQYNIIYNTI